MTEGGLPDRSDDDRAIRAEYLRLRTFIDSGFDVLLLLDAELLIEWVSPNVEDQFAYRPGALLGTGTWDLLHPDDIERAATLFGDFLTTPGARVTGDYRILDGAGRYRWAETMSTNLLDDPNVRAIVSSLRLIDDRKRAEDRLRASEERLAALVQNTDGITVIVDDANVIQWASMPAERVLGPPTASIIGSTLRSIIHDDDWREVERHLSRAREDPGSGSRVEAQLSAGEEHRWFDAMVTNLAHDPSVGGLVLNLRDTTERVAAEQALRESESRLEFQATHDALTLLPNRTLLLDRLGVALGRSRRNRKTVAVLFIDLDRFKVVNDSLGHGPGDSLLMAVGDRLTKALRPGDTIARFGGDEFVVICEDLDHDQHAVDVAERIGQVLTDPFTVGSSELFVTASVGVSVSTTADEQPEDLIRDADAAMYSAKSKGRARYEVFDADLHRRALDRLAIEHALHHAADHDELRVHYQPIVGLHDGLTHGLEALVRWEHPERGLLPPMEFIPIAEEIGLTRSIGRWVFEKVCRQLRDWDATGFPELFVTVNLSALELADPFLVSDSRSVMQATGVDPARVAFEITESVLMDDVDRSFQALQALRGLGVRLFVDDFGTGYSSLAYLNRFPVDVLKIDQSFLGSEPGSAENPELIGAIVNLGHSLGLEVTAEGVERDDQLARLRSLACDHAQGFLFSRPVPADDVGAAIRIG